MQEAKFSSNPAQEHDGEVDCDIYAEPDDQRAQDYVVCSSIEVAEIDGRRCTSNEFSEAYNFLRHNDSIMDEESVHHLHKYAVYRTWIKDVKKIPDQIFFSQIQISPPSSKSAYNNEWPEENQSELEALSLMIDCFQGYATMCDELGDWISAIDNTMDEFEKVQSTEEAIFPSTFKQDSRSLTARAGVHQNVGADILRRPLCLLIERHFSTDALRAFMDAKSETSSSWQPPPCYWAMMHIPEARGTLERIFARHRKSEFLAAFVEDYVFSQKAEPLTDDNLSQLTSNFRVFIHTSSRLIAKYLREDDETELVASTDPLQLTAFFCHTENAYMYIQALLSFIPRWRPDFSGCRRLSQVLFRTMRQTRREFRVAELSFLFSNLSNYPDLHRTFLRVYRTESDGRLRLQELDVFDLWTATRNVLCAFEDSRVLLYERDAIRPKSSPQGKMENDLSSAGALMEDELNFIISAAPTTPIDDQVLPSRKRRRPSISEPQFLTLEYFPTPADNRPSSLEPADVLRNKVLFCQKEAELGIGDTTPVERNVTQVITDAEELETFKRARMATLSDAIEKQTSGASSTGMVPPFHIDMPSASQVGGVPWREEYERLRETPELPPMETLRDSLLIESLLDEWIDPIVILSDRAKNDYLEFLLALTTYTPYELLVSQESSRATTWDASYLPDDPWREDVPLSEDEEYDDFGKSSNVPEELFAECSGSQLWDSIDVCDSSSLLESALYRNIHDNRKLGRAVGVESSDVARQQKSHKIFEKAVNDYKDRARREMMEIYRFLRMTDVPTFDVVLSFVFRHLKTSLAATAVLRLIEGHLFSDQNVNPLFRLDETLLFIFSRISGYHKQKRFQILQLIHRCMVADEMECPTLNRLTVRSSDRLTIHKNILDFCLWSYGRGDFCGVFSFLRANCRRFDLYNLRESIYAILSTTQPPFSRRFVSSLLETLASLLTDTNGLILAGPKEMRVRDRLVELVRFLHSSKLIKSSGLDAAAKNIQKISNWLGA